MADMTLPNSSTLDDVVDSLKEMNKKSTTLQEEALIYAEELNEKLVKEGPKMDKKQKLATEQLIATLESGKLDELEAQKEELLRKRSSDKLDKKRNSVLLDNLRQLKDQFSLLKKSFKELLAKKGPLGFLFSAAIRSAVFGLATGIIVGFLQPWKTAGLAIVDAFKRFGIAADKRFGLVKNVINPIKTNLINFSNRLKVLFGISTDKKGGLAKVATFVKTFIKDATQIFKVLGGNVLKVATAITGLFTGRVGAFQGIFNLAKMPPISNPLIAAVGRIISFILRPFQFLGAQLKRSVGQIFKTINEISKALTGGQGFFANLGTKLRNLFSGKLGQSFFKIFEKIKIGFFGLGKVLGQILRPVLAIFGFVTGLRDNLGKEEDQFNNIFRGIMGGLAKAFKLLVSSLLDFFIFTIPKFIFGLLGMDRLKNLFTTDFSFVEFFDNIFNTITDTVINFLNMIRDKVADIGIGGIVKNIGLSLMGILMKIALFPKAVAMGAAAALKAALPGGETPLDAFTEKFNAVMNGASAAVDSMKSKSDGLDKEGNIIDALSEEGKELEAQRKFDESIPGQIVSLIKGGDDASTNTTLISDGGFGSRIRNFKTNFMNRYFDD